jgi:hypothetical protein
VVIQPVGKCDNGARASEYVSVAGIRKPRIVQVE